jgi:hypothetical protein
MDGQLTQQEIDAIQSYAKEKGRNWKSSLANDWVKGNAKGDRGVILYRLRNRLGPSWLAKFQLP